jgi:hypothetical protein
MLGFSRHEPEALRRAARELVAALTEEDRQPSS